MEHKDATYENDGKCPHVQARLVHPLLPDKWAPWGAITKMCTPLHSGSFIWKFHTFPPHTASVCRRGWCFGWTLWPAAERCAVPHTVFVPREGAQEGPGVDVPQVDPPVAAAGV